MIDIPTDAYILNNFFLTYARFLFSIENLIGGYTSVFFPREHQKCPWTSFFRRCSRAQFCVHGHFFRKFTGKWMRSRALFGTFSRALFVVHGQKIWKCLRALFAVHGHFFLKSTKNAGICVFTGTFRRFTGTFFCKCSRALLRFTGTFLGSRARFFSKVHGQLQDVHGHFYENVHGHFLNVHA